MKMLGKSFAGILVVLMCTLAFAQPITLKVTPLSVPDDWHTKALYTFKDYLDENAPGQFDVQVFDSGQLFN